MKITSVNNAKVVYWAKLRMKKYRDIEHLFIVEGENLVNEAIKKGIVKEIITTDSKSYPFDTYEVTEDVMKRISSLVNPPRVMAVCNYVLPDDITGNVLILDNLQDPGNLGTIIRSAVAFNFNTIILSKDSVDHLNDKVIRSSEGMIFNVNIIRDDLDNIIPILKKDKYIIIGTDVRSGKNIKEYRGRKKIGIIIGNEGNGLSIEAKELCDVFVNINISKSCESLNAAVASSILMEHVYNG